MITTPFDDDELKTERDMVRQLLESELGVSDIDCSITEAGGVPFLKMRVGRTAPVYDHALRAVQKRLPDTHPFQGRLSILISKAGSFPESLEARCLETLLTRTTRRVAEGSERPSFYVGDVAFPNGEDHKVAQPASHLITGRRGVGKSTLILRAVTLLRRQPNLCCVVDMQAYSELSGDALARELLRDLARRIADDALATSADSALGVASQELRALSEQLEDQRLTSASALPAFKRALGSITMRLGGAVFVFLDDFHVIAQEEQADLLHKVHGALKGASGWLKVAGLESLLSPYNRSTRRGLQVAGDAIHVPLDLTLENPRLAEKHLRSILESFLSAVGYSSSKTVLAESAFKRLVWANAGVPRDFLQMLGRSIEHARRHQRRKVTLSDVNMAIGESGKAKLSEMEQDARNAKGALRAVLDRLEAFCLNEKKTNAFLVPTENTQGRQLIRVLSDLRLVHLIHQSITPSAAGKRYEAFILDYATFTGFRRKRNVREMVPEKGHQFRAAELRGLPKFSPDKAEGSDS